MYTFSIFSLIIVYFFIHVGDSRQTFYLCVKYLYKCSHNGFSLCYQCFLHRQARHQPMWLLLYVVLLIGQGQNWDHKTAQVNILPEKSIFSLVNEKIVKKFPPVFFTFRSEKCSKIALFWKNCQDQHFWGKIAKICKFMGKN